MVQPQAPQLILKLTRAQFVAGVVGTVFFLLTGVPCLWAGLADPGYNGAMLIWGALSVPMGIYAVSFYTASTTTISPSGITRRRLLRRHCYRWADIAAIDVVAKTYRGITTWRVRLTLANGRKPKLGAPYRSDMYPNPGFAEQVDAIKDYWRQQRGIDTTPSG